VTAAPFPCEVGGEPGPGWIRQGPLEQKWSCVRFDHVGDEEAGQAVQAVELLFAGRHGVDPCGVDVGVAEEVGQADDVLFVVVVVDREEVAEVVGEDFGPGDGGGSGEVLHHVEDVAAVDGSAGPGDEDAARFDALFPAPGGKHGAKAA